MDSFSIRSLTGNPSLEQMDIEDQMRADSRVRFSDGLPDDVAAEMAAAFGWDEPPTDDELEADYAARRCDEEELLARFPGLRDRSDQELITVVAYPPDGPDGDEMAAAAAIILERRLSGVDRRVA